MNDGVVTMEDTVGMGGVLCGNLSDFQCLSVAPMDWLVGRDSCARLLP